jgi:hypothetical protein
MGDETQAVVGDAVDAAVGSPRMRKGSTFGFPPGDSLMTVRLVAVVVRFSRPHGRTG